MSERSRFAAAREGELVAAAVEVGSAPERRREELVEQAEREDRWPRGYAEQVHDVAIEERLSPGLAFLLVRARIGVRDPSGDTLEEDASQEGPPGWIEADEIPSPAPRLEGRLRRSFRRLRGHIERADSVESAMRAFVAEPDVADCDY